MNKYMVVLSSMFMMASCVNHAMSSQQAINDYSTAILRAFYKNNNDVNYVKSTFYKDSFYAPFIEDIHRALGSIEAFVQYNGGRDTMLETMLDYLKTYTQQTISAIKQTKLAFDNNNRGNVEAQIRRFSELKDSIDKNLKDLKAAYYYLPGKHASQQLLIQAFDKVYFLMIMAQSSAELRLRQ